MSDRYLKFVNTPFGKTAAQSLGLPAPVPLKRWKRADQPFIEGDVLIGAANSSKAISTIGKVLGASAAKLFHASAIDTLNDSAKSGNKAEALPLNADIDRKFSALVFDATGMKDTTDLKAVYDFFHPTIRKLAGNGRVLVIGQDPSTCRQPAKAAAHQALEGFVRSVGKEVGKKGATANLLWMAPGAEQQLESSIRFFLSPRSAYVSGQVTRISKGATAHASNPVAPLAGKIALVTGASRGIGASIAETLSRDGATVIGLDIPPALEDLQKVMAPIKGKAMACDITDEKAPKQIADFVKEHFEGIDLVIHNAGITRDKTLGNMPEHFWDMTIAVNLTAEELIDEELMHQELLRENGRIVCISSISGIAGNFGQTNYSTAKCGVIGYVEAMAKQVKNGVTINAIAPGFIETQMTAAMPITIREAGRRMNSLSQGGLPVDVAEAIAWYCNPASNGVNGNVVRVCGQSLIGK
ncbi:3-oxoacyl-[acyl-carrier protein] reductase [Marinobacter salarius]|uniref:3-oxoacyl-[acyl-carrier protein] reductase n=1 Tax=Marinobacter salarius TaxID=1420917 RepID=A0ABY1FIH7_9GAMM|nr:MULTISPECIES: 3-oxoacyl-ACP reductase [Marinobacter]KXJ44757.1 MAG: 3-ketoacyl-ACP reductase [Marinobacter sp. Hex_13]MBS8230244.1 3-oxoacyl-ACP reductase [Marinobacter salarius]SFL41751.1 3-oxoacyl-[acyl-carrier protein] reductase [Marinobacter salarius]|tara:strand:+ start:10196 stop:11602 length:1407 start_codon:yes stop_codon:yes gene_type:complete